MFMNSVLVETSLNIMQCPSVGEASLQRPIWKSTSIRSITVSILESNRKYLLLIF